MRVSRTNLMRSALGAAVAVGVMTSLLAAAPAAETSLGTARSDTPGSDRPAAAAYTVTLVTGDVVTVRPAGGTDGAAAVTVDPAARADGHEPSFEIRGFGQGTDQRLTVVPDDAQALITAGRLDADLFDVAGLRDHGFGDGRAIPVLVQFRDRVRTSALPAKGRALAASRVAHTLESVNATALTVRPSRADQFWTDLQPDNPTASLSTRFDRGVSRVVLDRPVQAALDQSVPQVHAPEAWESGYDGTGATVAILDTGIDVTPHPDLADKVTASNSFIAGETVADGNGHGTHVASTVAGSGAASDGQYKGVAPGAELVVGKVLNDGGSGTVSGIIDGMEWAATEQSADVVNLSLGGDAPSDESQDVLSQAVNRLSDSTDALFVIAAGNDGPDATTVGSPGVAESALTVAAVDGDDLTADFSSRGPLPSSYTRILKPDVAAPGVHIAAARAAGTALCQNTCVQPGDGPIDAHYTSASGTSMATPHVAGAAAIVAQRHPNWTGQQIKQALTASADAVDGSAFEVGSGRLNVAAALDQTITTTGPLDLGRSTEPSTDPVSDTLTYQNTADTAANLTLEASLANVETGAAVPAEALSLPSSVQVPAAGSTEVDVTLQVADLPEGTYGGAIVATDAAGKVTRTAVGVVREPYTMRVTVFVSDRNGIGCRQGGACRNSSGVYATNLDNPEHSANSADGVLQLRPGRYQFSANVSFIDDRRRHVALLVKPEVEIVENDLGVQGVNLALSNAHPIEVETDRRTEPYVGTLLEQRRIDDWYTMGGWWTGYNDSSMWVLPAPEVSVGEFLLTSTFELGADTLSGRVIGGDRLSLNPRYVTYADTEAKFPARSRVETIDVGRTVEPDEAARLAGKIALIRTKRIEIIDQDSSYLAADEIADLTAAGALGALVWTPDVTDGVPRAIPMSDRTLPVAGLPAEEAVTLRDRLARGSTRVSLTSVAQTPYRYTLKFYERNSVPTTQRYTVADRDLARIPSEYRPALGSSDERRSSYDLGIWDGGGEIMSLTSAILLQAPADVTSLIGPIYPEQRWYRWTRGRDPGDRTYGYRLSALRAGLAPKEVWDAAAQTVGAAVANPAGPRACTTCRRGNTLYVRPTLAQPDPTVITDPVAPGVYLNGSSPVTSGLDARETKLFAGDQEIQPVSSNSHRRLFTVPESPTDLRLVYDSDRVAHRPATAYGAKMRSVWTFTSRTPERDNTDGTYCLTDGSGLCAVQQLLQLRYDADLDRRNRAPRDGSKLRLTSYYESSTTQNPDLTSLSVWVSFDDGVSWQRQRVAGSGNTRSIRLPAAPADATTVSLKVEAADGAGNTVTQVLPRAFGLT